MCRAAVWLVIGSMILSACQGLMPVPENDLPAGSMNDRGQGTFYGGVCHYGNGDIAVAGGGSIVCP